MPEKAAGKGLAAVDRYYQDYGCRARELKGEGKRIMGYLCAYVPVETSPPLVIPNYGGISG